VSAAHTCTVCLEPFEPIVGHRATVCPECEAAEADRADQAPDVLELMRRPDRWPASSWGAGR
jgi:hypothetical protein